MIPKDPMMLLSYLNTQLRDQYKSLSELCQSLDLCEAEIVEKMRSVNYEYDSKWNKFV